MKDRISLSIHPRPADMEDDGMPAAELPRSGSNSGAVSASGRPSGDIPGLPAFILAWIVIALPPVFNRRNGFNRKPVNARLSKACADENLSSYLRSNPVIILSNKGAVRNHDFRQITPLQSRNPCQP